MSSRPSGFDLSGGLAWPLPGERPALYEGLLLRRVLAYLIDVVLIGIVAAILWFVLSIFTVVSFGLLAPLQALILALWPITYHSLLIALCSATIGMSIMDIEIRTMAGGRPNLAQAVIATVVFYASITLTSFLILLITLFEDRGRTLHDMITGTLAVRRSAAGR